MRLEVTCPPRGVDFTLRPHSYPVKIKPTSTLVALALGASSFLTVSGQTTPALRTFGGSYFFGDSLTDSGNTFALTGSPPAPYYQGRVSNGPTYAEYLRPGLVAAATVSSNPANLNFAFAGATASPGSAVPNLTQQVGMFQARGLTGKATDLFVVLAGANDVLNTISTPATQNTAAVELSARTAATAVGANVRTLLGLGAKNVVVMNLPDISQTARFTTGSAASAAPLAAAGSRAFNAAIRSDLASVNLGADVTLRVVDLGGMLDSIIRNGPALGFTNTRNEVVGTLTGGGTVANPNSYVFWDGIHPTTAVHTLLASALTEVLNPEFVLGAADAQRAASQSLSDLATDVLDQRLARLRGGDANRSPTDGFVAYHSRSGGFDARGYSAGFEFDAQVITAGFDHRFSNALTGGIAFSVDSLDGTLAAGGGSLAVRGNTISVYGQWTNAKFFVEGDAGYGEHTLRDLVRATRLGGLTTMGETKGDHLGGSVKIGTNLDLAAGALRVTPYVGARYLRTTANGYSETGVGGLNFQFDEQSTNTITGLLGVNGVWSVKVGESDVGLGLSAVYQTDLGDDTRDFSGRLADTVATTTRVRTAGSLGDTVKLGASVSGTIGQRWGWMAGYTGDVRSEGDMANQFSVALQTGF